MPAFEIINNGAVYGDAIKGRSLFATGAVAVRGISGGTDVIGVRGDATSTGKGVAGMRARLVGAWIRERDRSLA